MAAFNLASKVTAKLSFQVYLEFTGLYSYLLYFDAF